MATPHRVDLPGLVGDQPLGFLAAIGLLSQLGTCRPLLSWDPQDRHAILHSDTYTSVADVVDRLIARLKLVGHHQAIPGLDGFPVSRKRGEPDPLLITPREFSGIERQAGSAVHWLKATVTDRATDARGFCAVNPLIALRGRQTVGSFWYYPMREVRQDTERLLTEALTGWRRVEGSEGWLLDHRATYSDDPGLRGPGGSMAVPGATWLATLAVDFFRYTWISSQINRGPRLPRGWFETDGRPVFVWPLWTLPIDDNNMGGVWNAGFGYGRWQPDSTADGSLHVTLEASGTSAPNSMDHTVDLGVFAMCAASRTSGGPLTPTAVHTRPPATGERRYPAWKGWDWEVPKVEDYPGRYGWG